MMSQQIAFITYETPFAQAGGVAAVVGRLPVQVAQASDLPVAVITPFHYKIPKTAALVGQLELVGRLTVRFDREPIPVNLLRLERNGTWYFLEAEDRRFFAGSRNPYDLPAATGGSISPLLRDSLFFGVAGAQALPLIAPGAGWIGLLQDWEAATAALALTAELDFDFRLFLTIHNSYDQPASGADLMRFGIDPAACPGTTILQRAIPLVEPPVFTVSDQFALDLRAETLQAEIMAPHLQTLLADNLTGVDNGLFVDLSVDQAALDGAHSGNFEPLRAWKAANRAQALQALATFQPTPDRPVWGDFARFHRDAAPWFVMAGRDDPRQKGYDVACLAISRFLAAGGEGRFLFFPIPGDEGLAGLGFLKKLAEQFPESVLALPFIFQEGYFAVLQGATYGIMPSLYEPFGMANEFYLKGAVGIGRATGGILQQIVPLRSARSFSQAVKQRALRMFGPAAAPTGLLFRERDALPSAVADWRAINAAEYHLDGSRPDRVEQRQSFTLFNEMANELQLALKDGLQLYTRQPELYYRMLTAGIDYIQQGFSWERAAQAYARVF